MKHLFLFAATVVTICALSADAWAAGFYLPGRGVKPLGRAGAYVAGSEHDLNALWYNPANLGGMTEFKLTVDFALIGLIFKHQRAPRTLENGEVITYPEVKNEAPPKSDPQLLVGGPLGIEGLSWGFGIYAPYLSGHTFPEDGPQRYVLVDNDSSLALILNLAIGWQIGENFRFGAGFQNMPASFQIVNVASGYTGLFGDPEDEDLDILTRITLKDYFVPSGNAGIWIKLADNLQFAASGQLGFKFKTKTAKLETRLPSHPEFQNAELNGDTLTGELNFPPVVRAGVRFVKDPVDIELAANWEGWSVLEGIDASPNDVSVTNLPGLGSIPVGPLTVPLEWKDTWSIRLGGAFKVSESFTPSAGYAYEVGAIPDETYSVFLADGNKHMLSLGGELAITDKFSIDAGFATYIIPKRTITTSKWRQINPTDDEGKVTLIVGNGEYSQTYIAGGVGVNFTF